MRHLLTVEPIVRRLSEAIEARRNGKRRLVDEIISIQVLSATVVGILAVAALYWGGQWVLKDSYGRWALQWTQELNELGSPLYLADDDEALIRLESFVARYPEIDRVSYFDSEGRPLFTVRQDTDESEVVTLAQEDVTEATDLVGAQEPYLLKSGILDPRRFEIVAPIWTESIAGDGLFNFDPEAADAEVTTELLGFVGIHLDYMLFHTQLLGNIKSAVLFLLMILIAFALFGRRALQRALASFRELRHPLRELAEGNLDVSFEPARHREIADIVEALETTTTALSERNEKLMELANHDNLTGLFNRRRFIEDLKSLLSTLPETATTSALLFIDLDRFKYINDSCGHPAGDRMIRRVAVELRRSIDSNGTVARFGGDEFVALVNDVSEDEARDAAEGILANMRQLTHVEDDRIFHVHCSIGIALIDGDNLDHDELMAQADHACREAKLAGRNRIAVFESSDEDVARATADAGWMSILRKAIDNDEFELRFQPINRIDTGETTHHEVLIRLRDESGRMIKPDAFLPAAIRFGLLSEIDLWMVRHASAAYAVYKEKTPEIRLSINLSANAFEADDLTSFVAKTFKEFGVDPAHIIFEITESLAVRRPAHVEQQIHALRELGCHLALDDFGTGYSSFSYLQKLHFDYIKIDGAFVENILDNPVDQKMIRLIAEIGHEAGMQTIAEYVQDAESLTLLGELGVDLAQGYFVGRPAKRPNFRSTPISLSYQRNKRTSQQ
ncbi:MAG: EAL domain-containing protein [Woeseiaceae bacterium]|nr:EAL domain-containing protein [Woeseiaceae bacterium]